MKSKMDGLQLGSYSMGERLIEGGEYERLTAMGSLDATQARIHNLNVLGDATANDCHIDILQVAGSMEVNGGRIDMVSIAGEMNMHNVDCGSIHVLGELQATTSTCRILRFGQHAYTGMFVFRSKKNPVFKGSIQGETLENFFPLTLTKQHVFTYILNCGQLYAQEDIECAKFFSFSLLSAQEINADIVYLYPCASVNVHEIHGSLVIIDPAFDEHWLDGIAMDIQASQLYNRASCRMVNVSCIEADEVVLDYVKCDTLRARKVVLGPHVKIGKIEYEESCDVHEDAQVKEIIKI